MTRKVRQFFFDRNNLIHPPFVVGVFLWAVVCFFFLIEKKITSFPPFSSLGSVDLTTWLLVGFFCEYRIRLGLFFLVLMALLKEGSSSVPWGSYLMVYLFIFLLAFYLRPILFRFEKYLSYIMIVALVVIPKFLLVFLGSFFPISFFATAFLESIFSVGVSMALFTLAWPWVKDKAFPQNYGAIKPLGWEMKTN